MTPKNPSLSNSSINKLGKRLIENDKISEENLKILHEFKKSYGIPFKKFLDILKTINIRGRYFKH